MSKRIGGGEQEKDFMALPIFRFPAPSGPYPVGTMTYHWIDNDRYEIFNPDPHARRELMAQIWYPARRDPSCRHTVYMQDAAVVTATFAQLHHKPKLLFAHFPYIRTHTRTSAPVSEGTARYPVLIFLEGLTGFRQMNTFQIEELASHGYIVVALDQPYTAANVVFPDGRAIAMLPVEQVQPLVRASYIPADKPLTLNGTEVKEGNVIPYLAQDITFTLDRLIELNRADPNAILTGRLDVTQVGAFGVSLGGIVVAQARQQEPRLKACLMMDAPVPVDVGQNRVQHPGMWITRDAQTMRLERQRAGGWPENEIEAHQTTMRAAFEGLEHAAYFVQIPGAFHSNFTDIPLLFPFASWLGITGPIKGKRAHSIINAYSLAFFDRHVRGRSTGLLNRAPAGYPDVIFETH